MKTQVINLSEPRAQDHFPAYVALYSSAEHNPFLLSPTAMRWSQRITLARLEDCRPFWLLQKKKLRCKLADMFAPLLRHHCGEQYIAVAAGGNFQLGFPYGDIIAIFKLHK